MTAVETPPTDAAAVLAGYTMATPAAILESEDVAAAAVKSARASAERFGGESEPVRRAIEALSRHHGRTF